MIDPLSGIPANVDILPSAKQLLRKLPARVRVLLVELLEVMEGSSQERSIPVSRVEVIAHRDPEESTETLEIRQWVDLPRKTAMEHWSRMGRQVEDWIGRQHGPSADLLIEWIAFTMYSDVDDAAA